MVHGHAVSCCAAKISKQRSLEDWKAPPSTDAKLVITNAGQKLQHIDSLHQDRVSLTMRMAVTVATVATHQTITAALNSLRPREGAAALACCGVSTVLDLNCSQTTQGHFSNITAAVCSAKQPLKVESISRMLV